MFLFEHIMARLIAQDIIRRIFETEERIDERVPNICTADFMEPMWNMLYINDFMRIQKESENVNEDFSAGVQYVERLLVHHNCIPKTPLCIQKNSTQSKRLRNIGNELFARGSNDDLYKALIKYNESLCMARPDSVEMSLCYANRSAIYFEWKMYDKCLENVTLAKSTGNYPNHLLHKLSKREADSREAIVVEKPTRGLYNFQQLLANSPHKFAPNVSSNVFVKKTKKSGRGIFAKEDINPGEVIAIDKSPVNVLHANKVYQRCGNCKAENQLSLIPCKSCTKTMYCGPKCMSEASKLHAFECPIIDYMYEHCNSKQLCLLRATIEAFLCFDSVEQLSQFITKYGTIKSNILSPGSQDTKITPAQRMFHNLYSLKRHHDDRKEGDQYRFAIFGAIAYHQLIRYTPFAKMCQTKDEKSLLINLLIHFYEVCAINECDLDNKIVNVSDEYGSGTYPFHSLINHSCAPNVYRAFSDDKCIIIALQPIKANAEILDTYG